MKLLDETLEYLKEKGIDPEKEVKWVGSRDGKYAMSFAEFAEKFAELAYYDQFGHQEIARDLVIVGEDWWLERVEYDGSEWWDLKKTPILSSAPKNFNCVRGGRLDPMLEDLNKDNGEQGNTKTPLIEDEEIRKAIRAWLSIQEQPIRSITMSCYKDLDSFYCYSIRGHIEDVRAVNGEVVPNKNLVPIEFEFRSNNCVACELGYGYSIEELCGEEQ